MTILRFIFVVLLVVHAATCFTQLYNVTIQDNILYINDNDNQMLYITGDSNLTTLNTTTGDMIATTAIIGEWCSIWSGPSPIYPLPQTAQQRISGVIGDNDSVIAFSGASLSNVLWRSHPSFKCVNLLHVSKDGEIVTFTNYTTLGAVSQHNGTFLWTNTFTTYKDYSQNNAYLTYIEPPAEGFHVRVLIGIARPNVFELHLIDGPTGTAIWTDMTSSFAFYNYDGVSDVLVSYNGSVLIGYNWRYSPVDEPQKSILWMNRVGGGYGFIVENGYAVLYSGYQSFMICVSLKTGKTVWTIPSSKYSIFQNLKQVTVMFGNSNQNQLIVAVSTQSASSSYLNASIVTVNLQTGTVVNTQQNIFSCQYGWFQTALTADRTKLILAPKFDLTWVVGIKL